MRPRTLNSAAKAGDSDAVLYHLNAGAEINGTTQAGHFPLGGAVYYGHVKVVKLLLDHGADIDQTSEFGWTPLYIAAWDGNTKLVALLVERGARLGTQTISGYNSPDGFTPLHIAAFHGKLVIVKRLVKAGASITICSGEGKSPLDLARENKYARVVKFLTSAGRKRHVRGATPSD